MKDIILILKSYKISGKYSKNNKPQIVNIFSSHPDYVKMWICSTSCLNITENRTTNMAGTREKMSTLFLQKQK